MFGDAKTRVGSTTLADLLLARASGVFRWTRKDLEERQICDVHREQLKKNEPWNSQKKASVKVYPNKPRSKETVQVVPCGFDQAITGATVTVYHAEPVKHDKLFVSFDQSRALLSRLGLFYPMGTPMCRTHATAVEEVEAQYLETFTDEQCSQSQGERMEDVEEAEENEEEEEVGTCPATPIALLRAAARTIPPGTRPALDNWRRINAYNSLGVQLREDREETQRTLNNLGSLFKEEAQSRLRRLRRHNRRHWRHHSQKLQLRMKRQSGRGGVAFIPPEVELTLRKEPPRLFSCPESGCRAEFFNPKRLETHLNLGKHQYEPDQETLQDHALNLYAGAIERMSLSPIQLKSGAYDFVPANSNHEPPPEGWALPGKAVVKRLNNAQKEFLRHLFMEGERTKRKEDPKKAAQKMKENLKPNDWLKPSQIASFFSRLTSEMRKKNLGRQDDLTLEVAVEVLDAAIEPKPDDSKPDEVPPEDIEEDAEEEDVRDEILDPTFTSNLP